MPGSIYAFVHSGRVLADDECRALTNQSGALLFTTLIANYHYEDDAGLTFQAIHFNPPLCSEPVKQALEAKLGTPLSEVIRMSASTGAKEYDSVEMQRSRTVIRHTMFMNKNSARFGSYLASGLKTDMFGCFNPDYVGHEQWNGFHTGSDATMKIED